jgi:diguanylate cyclase (GGDEF)-like protein
VAEQVTIEDAAVARIWILATGVLTTLVAWAVVAAIARSIRGSLRQVSEAARALAAGNLSVRSDVASLDEVGELAGSLNKMADDLQGLIDRLLADASRDAFTAQLMQALEMAETEPDVHEVTARAMSQAAPDLQMEMLLAAHEQSELRAVAEHPQRGRAGCGVESLGGCAAIRRGAPLVFEDSDALNACPKLRGRPGGAISAVCVPVTFMGRSLGVVHVAGAVRKPPAARQVAQFTAMGMQCGARIGAVRAFARAQMHANTDALTGLPNRRSLEAAIAELQAERRPYAFVMADLDHFKRLNDAQGHEAGDRALKLFAEVLRAHVRQSDVAARWGGEEFALLFRDATAGQVAEVLERIRGGLAEALCASGSVPFTASFGAADSAMAASQGEIARLADEALYASKQRGRDRVSISGQADGSTVGARPPRAGEA